MEEDTWDLLTSADGDAKTAESVGKLHFDELQKKRKEKSGGSRKSVSWLA